MYKDENLFMIHVLLASELIWPYIITSDLILLLFSISLPNTL